MSNEKDNFLCLLGKRILEERDRLNLKQKQISELCGISRVMWGRYERGEAAPGADVLFRFAANGADINYLMTGQRAHLISEENPGYTLRPDQKALLDNLENCPKEDQDAIKRMALRCAGDRTDEPEEQKKNRSL